MKLRLSLLLFQTSKNYAWASSSASILSEFGTMSLEFNYLSDVTGNQVFRQKIAQITSVIKKQERQDGLYPNYLNPKTGRWGQQHISLGALGDSFYEYLLKSWLQSGKTDEEARDMYIDAMDAAVDKLCQKSNGGLTYFAEMKFGRLEHKMDHLACFTGKLTVLPPLLGRLKYQNSVFRWYARIRRKTFRRAPQK